jgi:Conserved hypothetical ATP binding protein
MLAHACLIVAGLQYTDCSHKAAQAVTNIVGPVQAFASEFPTMVAYVIDTPRCTQPQVFMSNMLQVRLRCPTALSCFCSLAFAESLNVN